MRNKFIPAILLFALCSFSAQAATVVTITDKSGSSKDYKIEESGKLYFSDNALMINEKAGAKDVNVQIADIRKIMFKSGSVGVDGNASNAISLFAFPNPVKDVLFLAGVGNGEKVSVFAVNGSLAGEYTYSDEGINLSSLPAGAYMITVSGKTVKITKL